MALETMIVADKDGEEETINKIPSGPQADVDSAGFTLSTNNVALLTANNTKLDSLISLIGATNSALAATNSALNTIDGRVDGLETLVGATNTAVAAGNTLLTTQNGYLDTVETLIGTTNTLNTAQNGYLDGVEGSLTSILAKIIAAPATDALQTALNTLVGAQSAAAWTTGDGTLISLLKAIAGSAVSTSPAVIDPGIFYVDVTLTTDTSAYASGDLIADAQVAAACVRSNDALGMCVSAALIDEDDQGVALTVHLYGTSASWGTENSAPSITDANARAWLGLIDFAVSDYKDLGGSKVALKSNQNIPIKPATGTDDIYVAVVNGTGTPTFTANGLKLRLGFVA